MGATGRPLSTQVCKEGRPSAGALVEGEARLSAPRTGKREIGLLATIAAKYKIVILLDKMTKLGQFVKSAFPANRGTFRFFAHQHRGAELAGLALESVTKCERAVQFRGSKKAPFTR